MTRQSPIRASLADCSHSEIMGHCMGHCGIIAIGCCKRLAFPNTNRCADAQMHRRHRLPVLYVEMARNLRTKVRSLMRLARPAKMSLTTHHSSRPQKNATVTFSSKSPISDSINEPTSAPSAAASMTKSSSWQWMVTVALGGAVVAAFL
jgi:hypothetical protein